MWSDFRALITWPLHKREPSSLERMADKSSSKALRFQVAALFLKVGEVQVHAHSL